MAVALVGLGGCYPVGPGYRSLHVVDGEVVHSPAPPPSAYEAYVRARLALDHDPPQLGEARYHLDRALRADPRDPHLWFTLAQLEELEGHVEEAKLSARRALTIRPGYPPAHRVLTRLEAGASAPTPVAQSP